MTMMMMMAMTMKRGMREMGMPHAVLPLLPLAQTLMGGSWLRVPPPVQMRC